MRVRYRGFGLEPGEYTDTGLLVTGTGPTQKSLLASRIIGEQVTSVPLNRVEAAPNVVVNARIATSPAEEITPDDPRHPQHLEWLADQAVMQKKARMRAVVPYIAAGGGGLLVVVLAALVIRKRRSS